MTAVLGYHWSRPALDAPGSTLIPVAAFVEHFGVPSSNAALSVHLAHAEDVVYLASLGRRRKAA